MLIQHIYIHLDQIVCTLAPGCSLDQGSLCPINQLFCLSRQALHRPPPGPMKEHHLSPMCEEPLSAPANEERSQNMGGGPTGVASGTVGGAGSNKKPRSRTKVPMVIVFSHSAFCYVGLFISLSSFWHLAVCILDFSRGPGYPAELHPGCWPVPRPGGYSYFVRTAWPTQTHHH